MNENEKMKDAIVKIMAVVGTIAVLSLGGFLTISVINKTPEFFSNLTAQVATVTSRFISGEHINVSLSNENPQDGDQVRISFEHINKKENGSYSFFYECREGVYFERNEEVIFCNTPYSFINSNKNLVFRVFSSDDELVEVPLSINFVRNNSDRISERGEATLNINGDRTQTGGTILVVGGEESENENSSERERFPGERTEEIVPLPGTSQNTNPNRNNTVGVVDLKATIIAVGKVNRTTNEFTATSTVSLFDRGAVKFEVENIGTIVSKSWTFNVVVPTFPSFIYHSQNQQPLYPGDRIEYVIGFDSIKDDGEPNIIIVNVDPISSISESSEDNNIVRAELRAI